MLGRLDGTPGDIFFRTGLMTVMIQSLSSRVRRGIRRVIMIILERGIMIRGLGFLILQNLYPAEVWGGGAIFTVPTIL